MIRKYFLLAISVLLLSGCPPGTATPEGPNVPPGGIVPPPEMEAEPPAAPAGSEHFIRVFSFAPGEVVELQILSQATEAVIFQTSFEVNEEGFGEVIFRSDPQQEPGLYLVIATGTASDTTVRTEIDILPPEQ